MKNLFTVKSSGILLFRLQTSKAYSRIERHYNAGLNIFIGICRLRWVFPVGARVRKHVYELLVS